MEKVYQGEVQSSANHCNIPEAFQFGIDKACASEIIRLAGIVKANKLYKIETFSYLTVYFNVAPSTPEEANNPDPGNLPRTECDCLNVGATGFWFSAFLKHDEAEISTPEFPISELAEHFGLSQKSSATTTQVVILASEGIIRAVATRQVAEGAVPCVLVDYDTDEFKNGKEAFEISRLGCSREDFDKTATYIW